MCVFFLFILNLGPGGQPPLPPEEPPQEQPVEEEPKPAEVEAMAPPEVTPEQAEHYKVSFRGNRLQFSMTTILQL